MSIVKLEAAEAAIIGSMLIDADCVGDVLTRVQAGDFIDPRYRRLFEAVRDLYNSGAPVDPVLVLDRAGGDAVRDVLQGCMDRTPTAANVLHYCEVLREQAGLHRIHEAADCLAEVEDLAEAQDILARVQGELSAKPGVQVVNLAQLMADFLRRVSGPKPEYLHWGLGMLDKALHVDRSQYVIIGARPSTGKTALALQLGLSIANEKRVGFFSLETVPEVAGDRIAALSLDITLPAIQERRVDPTALQILAHQLSPRGVFQKNLTNFEFISAAGMTVEEIRTLALARRYDVIFIDYVQLLRSSSRGERTEQMQDVSMAIRAMAQTTGLVIVALAQLRRPEGVKKVPAPTMADLKESGQFEQDANVVLLMYHTDPDNKASDRLIKIDKNKEGYIGLAARFRFEGKKQRFVFVDKDGKDIAEKSKFQEIGDDQMEMEPPDTW